MLAVSQTARHHPSAATPDFSSRSSRASHPDRRSTRPGQRAIYGLADLARRYAREDIEGACEKVLTLSAPSYQAVERLLEQRAAKSPDTGRAPLAQAGEDIRPINDYLVFFEQHAEAAAASSPTTTERNPDEHVSH